MHVIGHKPGKRVKLFWILLEFLAGVDKIIEFWMLKIDVHILLWTKSVDSESMKFGSFSEMMDG